MTDPPTDPAAGVVYDKNAPMLDTRIRKREIIRLGALVGTDGTLADHTFVACHIHGPAIVVLADSQILGSDLGKDPTAFLWPVDTAARPEVNGVVILLRCLFERCFFINIGFAGPTDEIERLREQLTRRDP